MKSFYIKSKKVYFLLFQKKLKNTMQQDFHCFQCAYTSHVRKNLLLHLWAAHLIDNNTYLCPLCDNYFTESKFKLRNHLKVSHRPPRANKFVLNSITRMLSG